ncbi:Asparagine synthetase [glutamine-hydrolyzing] [plant metagenome]|uniref:Asparagine synthetase [glutamine-hydrolyzing] n=1 Tax=plant metagenome TaxID=1297885 RepID=A0A484QRW6_9ZZZZ
MGCRYVVLVDAPVGGDGEHEPNYRAPGFDITGMEHRLTCGRIKLFASPGTPTLAVPGGVLIGHLFFGGGEPVTPRTAPDLSSHERVQDMLSKYWGEYVLIRTTAAHGDLLEVLRDPSGGVSCIYSLHGRDGCGFVTSDIALATQHGLYRKQIDWEFISHALAYPHLKTQRTGLSGVSELLPGCTLLVGTTDTTVRADWSPWTFVAKERRHYTVQRAVEDVRQAVRTVVAAWAGMDESILLELSGGLDSSILAGCLRGTSTRVACCTLVTPVPGADERKYAGQMANYLGVPLQEEPLQFEDARFDFVPSADTVTPRVSMLQYASNEVMKRAGTSNDVNSYFSGGGGDSVFCYLGNAAPAADAFKERGLAAGITAIRELSTLHRCTFWKAGRLTFRKLIRGPKPVGEPDRSFLSPASTTDAELHPWSGGPPDAFAGDRERISDLAATQVFRDSMPRGALRWLRLPLLSQPVMEACLRVPTWMWISGGQNRAVARSAFADILPPEVLNRRSKGTFMTYSGALYQRHKGQMLDYLLNGHLQARGLLDADALRRFMGGDLPARDQSFMRIFELCTIENWVRHQY